jgi:heterodisulfide reductase subunit A
VTQDRRAGPRSPPGEAARGRVGLIFCRCGPNLGKLVALDALERERWEGADEVATHPVLCSEEGRTWLAAHVRERGLERVVVAACSPREHETTFRRVLGAAGRSPFLLSMVNVREGAEWTSAGAAGATARARRLVRAGLARVLLQEPIEAGEVEASADVLVVGGGPAGLSAARTLARRGRRVVLIERDAALGGLAGRLDEIFPDLSCASCFMEPVLDEVLHHERVEVVTGAEVRRVRGSLGRFRVEVEVQPRRVDPTVCLGCGQCASVCPVRVVDSPDGVAVERSAIHVPWPGCLPHASVVDPAACLHVRGEACDACAAACGFGAVRLEERPVSREVEVGAIVVATGLRPGEVDGPDGVVSSWQVERMLHPDGPTGGDLRGAGGRPPRSVLLAAAGGDPGDVDLGAREILKLAHLVRARLPGARVCVAGGLGRAPQLSGPAAALAAEGVELVDGDVDPRAISGGPDGVAVPLGGSGTRRFDLVVLHGAARAAEGAADLARLLRIDADARGFLSEGGASPFEPTATRIAGVFVAGAAAGPRPIRDAIRDGAAAAGQILSALWPGERIALEPLAAEVDPERCGGCGVCLAACAFGAISVDRDGGRRRARVEAVLCRGCGTCAAACPTGAAQARHFTGSQIASEITALLSSAGR